MDIVLGLLLVGLVLAWLARAGGSTSTPPVPRDPAPPSTWTSTAAPAARPIALPAEAHGETEALVDGLIIGHDLARRAYTDRLEEERTRAVEAARRSWERAGGIDGDDDWVGDGSDGVLAGPDAGVEEDVDDLDDGWAGGWDDWDDD
jgi:hypothetical protein